MTGVVTMLSWKRRASLAWCSIAQRHPVVHSKTWNSLFDAITPKERDRTRKKRKKRTRRRLCWTPFVGNLQSWAYSDPSTFPHNFDWILTTIEYRGVDISFSPRLGWANQTDYESSMKMERMSVALRIPLGGLRPPSQRNGAQRRLDAQFWRVKFQRMLLSTLRLVIRRVASQGHAILAKREIFTLIHD